MECGARRGQLPRATAEWIGVAPPGGPRLEQNAVDTSAAAEEIAAIDGEDSEDQRRHVAAFSPLAIAVAVMALLAFGVLVGSAVSPVQQGSAATPIVLAVAHLMQAPSTPLIAHTPTPPPSAPPSEETLLATNSTATPPTSATPPAKKHKAPSGNTKGLEPGGGGLTTLSLPPIKHVFLIVLSDQDFNTAFGPSAPATYLSKTLTGDGELLDDYYALSGGELANEIALVSGQGPTPQTAEDCPVYTDVTPGTVGALGQALGSGCVYPNRTLTLAQQLSADGLTWKAYVEGIGEGAAQPPTCAHPVLGSTDADHTATAEVPYVTWRDPFVYFESVIDNATCTRSVVGLGQLAPSLKTAKSTPSLAYIVPDRCHDGSEEPCAPGQPAGLAAADGFLSTVVPQIESSAAYKAGGLIAITFDQAPQSGPNAESSGCCTTSAFPNLPPASGSASDAAPSASGAGTVPTDTAGAPPADTTGAPPTGTTGAPPAGTTTTSTPTETGATTTGATPAAATGGGRVGLLLISRYTTPASINVTGEYNDFSLLASIEDLFGVSRLGYADSPGLLAFNKSVYNAHR